MLSDAEKLKLFRIKHNFATQNDLAKALGFEQASTISNVENGSRPISKKIAAKIKEKFDVDILKKEYRTNTLRKKDFSQALSKIGKKLIKIQIENDLNPAEMAKTLDISLGRYEKLTTKNEKLYFDEIISIVENFDVSLNWLLLDEEYEPQEISNIEKAPSKNLSQKELEILKVIKLAKENKLI